MNRHLKRSRVFRNGEKGGMESPKKELKKVKRLRKLMASGLTPSKKVKTVTRTEKAEELNTPAKGEGKRPGYFEVNCGGAFLLARGGRVRP